MSVGENIRRLRLSAKLTQQELADKLNVTRSTVTQWERGWSMPRMSKLRSISEVFDVPYSEVVAESADKSGYANNASHRSTVALVSLGTLSQQAFSKQDATPITIEMDSSRTIEVPPRVLARHANALALLAEDNCMDRVAPRGMAMVFDPSLAPKNGQVAVLSTPDHGTIVRRFYKGKDTLMLVADSHGSYDDILVKLDVPMVVHGTVVWVQTPQELG